MLLIKRYPNRKLYDTEAKQYITLDGVAELIRQGEEIQIVDHATGDDLTTLTLTQIILEQEKKQNGLLPHSILAGLIQAGGDRLNALQRTLASSVNLWRQIDEEIKRRVQTLISQGELTEGEGYRLLDKLQMQSAQPEDEISLNKDELERILAEHQVPTRADLQVLIDQLNVLSAKLDEIHHT